MANVIYTVPLADEALSLNSNIGNVIITGGNANFVITTDGTGNLSFVDPTTIGLSGYSGISGYSGKADRYLTTSTTSLTIATGTQTLTVDTGLAYSPSQSITIANNSTNYMTGEVTTYATGNGQLVANVTTTVGSGTYTSWTINLAGATGAQGASGTSGTSGFSGFSGRSGTSGISGTSGRSGTSGISGRSGTSGISGSSGYSGYSGYSGVIGFSGYSGISGTSGISGSSGVSGDPGPSNIINATLDTSTTTLYPVMVGATGSNQTAKGTALVYNSNTGNLHANLLTGTLTTASQPNITSVGTLSGLTVTNPISGSVTGSASTVTNSSQPNITSVGNSLTTSGNLSAGNASLGNLASANYFSGNGSLLTGIGNIANANYATFAGTIINPTQSNITAVGNLTALRVNGTSNLSNVNITGISNLGPASNIIITGGNNSYYLQTDGTGNLTWAAGTGSGNGVAAGANTQIQYTDGAGNFQATPGFTFNNANNNVNMPNNLSVIANVTANTFNGQWNGTLWSNVQTLSVPSLIMASPDTGGSIGGNINYIGYPTTVSSGIPTGLPFGNANTPWPGRGIWDINSPQNEKLTIPIMYNSNVGNANLIVRDGSNIFVNNIAGGGKNPVIVSNPNTGSAKRYVLLHTNNNRSTLYISVSDSGNSNTWFTSNTTSYGSNQPVDMIYLTSNVNLAILNDPVANTSTSIRIQTSDLSNTITILGSSSLGNVPMHQVVKNSSFVFTISAYVPNTLGRYGIASISVGSFSTAPIPTVTPGATESFAYCTEVVNNNFLISARDYNSGTGLGNTYTAIFNGSTWTTTNINANAPTSMICTAPNVVIGIQNYGNTANASYVVSTNGGNTWNVQSSNLSPASAQIFGGNFLGGSPYNIPTNGKLRFNILNGPNITNFGISINATSNFSLYGGGNVSPYIISGNILISTGTYKILGSFQDYNNNNQSLLCKLT